MSVGLSYKDVSSVEVLHLRPSSTDEIEGPPLTSGGALTNCRLCATICNVSHTQRGAKSGLRGYLFCSDPMA